MSPNYVNASIPKDIIIRSRTEKRFQILNVANGLIDFFLQIYIFMKLFSLKYFLTISNAEIENFQIYSLIFLRILQQIDWQRGKFSIILIFNYIKFQIYSLIFLKNSLCR